jgi:hypothetical protein
VTSGNFASAIRRRTTVSNPRVFAQIAAAAEVKDPGRQVHTLTQDLKELGTCITYQQEQKQLAHVALVKTVRSKLQTKNALNASTGAQCKTCAMSKMGGMLTRIKANYEKVRHESSVGVAYSFCCIQCIVIAHKILTISFICTFLVVH